MNINNLEKIKVYDRYDGDLLSLLYDETINEYYIEIVYALWDKYLYFKVDLEKVIKFTFGKISFYQLIENKEALLYTNGIFDKNLGECSPLNIVVYQSGWEEYFHTDWTLQEYIAFHLLGYSLYQSDNKDGIKYIDKNGGLFGEIELDNSIFLLEMIQLISVYNKIEIKIFEDYFETCFSKRIIKTTKIHEHLIKILEIHFFGISQQLEIL